MLNVTWGGCCQPGTNRIVSFQGGALDISTTCNNLHNLFHTAGRVFDCSSYSMWRSSFVGIISPFMNVFGLFTLSLSLITFLVAIGFCCTFCGNKAVTADNEAGSADYTNLEDGGSAGDEER